MPVPSQNLFLCIEGYFNFVMELPPGRTPIMGVLLGHIMGVLPGHMKRFGRLVVSLRGVNQGFWSVRIYITVKVSFRVHSNR